MRQSSSRRSLALGCLIAVGGMVGCSQMHGTAPELANVKSIEAGNDAPIRLADYRGKVVLLDFWATW